MAEFKQIIDDALDILKFDGAVQDTLAELREKWGAQVPALLDERFDAVGVQYMKLSHEKGAAALGQELSAFGWALYNLDDEDEYLFALIPEEERSEWERYCKKQGQYCHLMKQQGRKWGDHAKEQDPGKLMPCEEYILQDEYDYFFNSLAGDFAAGEWKNQDAEEWKNGCVADLRQRPPQVTRAHSLPHLGCLTYSAENGLYAASRAAGSGTIGRALLSKNPATLNWFEPSPIGYDGPPRTLCWADHSLWVGDPTNATRIELTDRGTCQDVKNWPLPEDGWSTDRRAGPGLLFQRVVQGADLPLGKRQGNKTHLLSGRIRPSLRGRSRSRHRPHYHDPRSQWQGADGRMPAGTGHGHRAVPHRPPAWNGRGAETSLVYRGLAAGAGKRRDPLR